jgi:ABC-type multidrug transport system fused ATPase/permease subunit
MKESEYNIDVKENDKIYDIIDEENNNLIINIFKGIITGFLIAYLIILGLRPAALYPDNILEVIDNPWIFVILIIVNFYVIQWDFTIGLLLLLSIIALILDIIIFTEGKIFLSDEKEEKYSNGDTKSIEKKTTPASTSASTSASATVSSVSPISTISTVSSIVYSSYRDINDIIIDELKKYNNVNSKKSYASNFL